MCVQLRAHPILLLPPPCLHLPYFPRSSSPPSPFPLLPVLSVSDIRPPPVSHVAAPVLLLGPSAPPPPETGTLQLPSLPIATPTRDLTFPLANMLPKSSGAKLGWNGLWQLDPKTFYTPARHHAMRGLTTSCRGVLWVVWQVRQLGC